MQALKHLFLQSLDKFGDEVVLVKAVLMCLTHVVVVLPKDSHYTPLLFWVAVCCMQVYLLCGYIDSMCVTVSVNPGM